MRLIVWLSLVPTAAHCWFVDNLSISSQVLSCKATVWIYSFQLLNCTFVYVEFPVSSLLQLFKVFLHSSPGLQHVDYSQQYDAHILRMPHQALRSLMKM